jgi:hypothetical protein
MSNERVRQIYQFVAVSGAGKRQSALGVFQPNGDIDVRDKCKVTVRDNVNRRDQFDCDGVDLIRQDILDRDTIITLDYKEDGLNAQILARWIAYMQGVAADPSGATTNEIQTLTRSGTVSGGTFTLTLVHEGKTGVTEPIPYNASTSDILAALLKKTGTSTAMGKLLKAGDVAVGGTWGAGITLTFGGRFAAANVAAFTVDNALITGGGTVVDTETTPGNQKVHAISRSTDGTLPLFSLITGDKHGAYDYFKYGDAVVNSISFETAQEAGALLGVTVEIFCNYVASRLSSYSVPACVNITPLKVADCKVKINGEWETPDLAALTAALNNNVPRAAALAYDDIDISNAYQRGDRPTQSFTLSVYGSPDTDIYQLAEAEDTSGNEVPFVLYFGNAGDRVTLTGATTKIRFQEERLGYFGPLRQSAINIVATPMQTPPLSFSAVVSQSATFLAASS